MLPGNISGLIFMGHKNIFKIKYLFFKIRSKWVISNVTIQYDNSKYVGNCKSVILVPQILYYFYTTWLSMAA